MSQDAKEFIGSQIGVDLNHRQERYGNQQANETKGTIKKSGGSSSKDIETRTDTSSLSWRVGNGTGFIASY